MLVQQLVRRDTAADWTTNNTVLGEGEFGIELHTNPIPDKVKIGDGVTAWNDLPYMTQGLPGTDGTDGTNGTNGTNGAAGIPGETPEAHGAVGNGTTDDTAAIQAAIDAAYALGGGNVYLSKKYGWTGIITVKDGVRLVAQVTRQAPGPAIAPAVPGLIALASSCQLKIGDWTSTSKPAGVTDLFVDGNFIGGDSGVLAHAGLVRVEGVGIRIENLQVIRSAGDGIVYNATQNSTISGGGATICVGAALVLDNGPGALSFLGGYYGTSKGGSMICRDTAGETNAYPFGPTQCTFDGTIFEAYTGQAAPIAEPYAYHVRISGRALTFINCNFTAGATNSANCAVLIDDSCSIIPGTVTFVGGVWWTATGYDANRIAGNTLVNFIGQPEVSDNGTNHALSFVCIDTGAPHISMAAEPVLALDSNGDHMFRSINGGATGGIYENVDSGINRRMRTLQVAGIRRDGDTYYRQYVTRDGTFAWFDGAAATTLAYIQRGAAGVGNGLDFFSAPGGAFNFIGGQLQMQAGFYRKGPKDSFQGPLVTADGTYTVDTSIDTVYRLNYFVTGASTVNLSNAVAGREITLMMSFTGAPTISWGSNIRFAGGAAPAVTAGRMNAITFRYDSSYSMWFEISRSVAVPLT